ncbi:MAG: T9SS type A sorting domain-containing protein [Bacteroidetes bacterium]|nr:T9SS type A sorting domain-containing protein [Bacteroidota bacterium]
MIKKLLLCTLVVAGLNGASQSFSGMYPFTGVTSGTANTGTTDPTPPPTAPGLTFGSFSAVGTSSVPSTSGAFSFSGWGPGATNGDDATFTGSLNPGQYYGVTLTPSNNSSVTINSITFNMVRSTTGPRHWALRGNADSYAVNLPASVNSNTNLAVVATDVFFWAMDSYTLATGKQVKGCTVTPGASYSNQTTPMTFRFYAYDSEGSVGTFRIDTVIFNGSASIVVGLNTLTHDLRAKFKLYPNPSNDGLVTIEPSLLSITKIEVINILGAVVLTKSTLSEEKIKLELGTLPAGTYFVRMSSESKTSTEKLIISK